MNDMKWIDRYIQAPNKKPDRNIEILYFDAARKQFKTKVSSQLSHAICFTHWRELRKGNN